MNPVFWMGVKRGNPWTPSKVSVGILRFRMDGCEMLKKRREKKRRMERKLRREETSLSPWRRPPQTSPLTQNPIIIIFFIGVSRQNKLGSLTHINLFSFV